MLSIFYGRIKNISILPCKDFSKRCILSPKSKYYKDAQLIFDSCEVRNMLQNAKKDINGGVNLDNF